MSLSRTPMYNAAASMAREGAMGNLLHHQMEELEREKRDLTSENGRLTKRISMLRAERAELEQHFHEQSNSLQDLIRLSETKISECEHVHKYDLKVIEILKARLTEAGIDPTPLIPVMDPFVAPAMPARPPPPAAPVTTPNTFVFEAPEDGYIPPEVPAAPQAAAPQAAATQPAPQA
ncbi:hypothetical protein PAPYR_10558 [Paratrimastix pyriformis]|uniref:Uncharacterized protein n=1 Tax=Paratrimastix pyriformis TaxID=342808 RepID=A0ABQ8U8B4_9EUKA|nr:hypothetical protein PAPYR_10558 [Paratrimastix pyriformis]